MQHRPPRDDGWLPAGSSFDLHGALTKLVQRKPGELEPPRVARRLPPPLPLTSSTTSALRSSASLPTLRSANLSPPDASLDPAQRSPVSPPVRLLLESGSPDKTAVGTASPGQSPIRAARSLLSSHEASPPHDAARISQQPSRPRDRLEAAETAAPGGGVGVGGGSRPGSRSCSRPNSRGGGGGGGGGDGVSWGGAGWVLGGTAGFLPPNGSPLDANLDVAARSPCATRRPLPREGSAPALVGHSAAPPAPAPPGRASPLPALRATAGGTLPLPPPKSLIPTPTTITTSASDGAWVSPITPAHLTAAQKRRAVRSCDQLPSSTSSEAMPARPPSGGQGTSRPLEVPAPPPAAAAAAAAVAAAAAAAAPQPKGKGAKRPARFVPHHRAAAAADPRAQLRQFVKGVLYGEPEAEEGGSDDESGDGSSSETSETVDSMADLSSEEEEDVGPPAGYARARRGSELGLTAIPDADDDDDDDEGGDGGGFQMPRRASLTVLEEEEEEEEEEGEGEGEGKDSEEEEEASEEEDKAEPPPPPPGNTSIPPRPSGDSPMPIWGRASGAVVNSASAAVAAEIGPLGLPTRPRRGSVMGPSGGDAAADSAAAAAPEGPPPGYARARRGSVMGQGGDAGGSVGGGSGVSAGDEASGGGPPAGYARARRGSVMGQGGGTPEPPPGLIDSPSASPGMLAPARLSIGLGDGGGGGGGGGGGRRGSLSMATTLQLMAAGSGAASGSRLTSRRGSVLESHLKASASQGERRMSTAGGLGMATTLQLMAAGSSALGAGYRKPSVAVGMPGAPGAPPGPLAQLVAASAAPKDREAAMAAAAPLQPTAPAADGAARTGEALWDIVRPLLWRILNPSVAFRHMVRRALFTHRMATVLQMMPAFSKTPMFELTMMVCAGCEIVLTRYKSLYREGGKAENMYILLEGTVEHTSLTGDVSEALRIQKIAGDGTDGKHGLACGMETLTDVARSTTATAITNCRLLQFSAADLGLSRDKVKREFVRGELAAVPIFHGVSVETFERMLSLVDVDEVDVVGHDIIRFGSVPSHFCILVHGNVDVILSNGLCVAKLTAHAAETHNSYPFFGEMGLLANKPAMANVRASSACKVLTVSRASFSRFLNLVPDFEERIKAIAEIRRKQTELLSAQKKSREEMSTATFNQTAQALLQQPRMVKRESNKELRAIVQAAAASREGKFVEDRAGGAASRRPSANVARRGSVTQIEKADDVLQKLGIKPASE